MKRLVYIILTVGLIFLLAACTEEDEDTVTEEQEEERVVAVETAEVTEEDFILERNIYGRSAPEQVTPVTIPLPGEVTELHRTDGEEVEEGDEIAVLATAQGNTTITAPADGQVSGLAGGEGGMVSNEEPFAMIAETDNMFLDFSVTAAVRDIFEMDHTYTATIDNTEFEATITKIDAMPDDTGLYPVQATVENPDHTILAGMVAKLSATEEVIEDALTVPTAALVLEDNENFVFVISDGQAERRSIEILETATETAAIEGDIAAGDQVVVAGQLTLSDGDQVDVQEGE